jgi:polyisoprenyl-phosphate glycosyltransferase
MLAHFNHPNRTGPDRVAPQPGGSAKPFFRPLPDSVWTFNSENAAPPLPPTYSFVVPIFNEEAVVPILLGRLDALLDSLDAPGEVIVVDDGSDDTSAIVIEGKVRADKRYRLIKLSRNFGHQIAITTGMDHAAGRAVVVMDADLQDPPEFVHEMIGKWKEGYEVVSAERASRAGESRFKLLTAHLFYRLMAMLSDASIPRNAGDFRLVDRRALDCFLAMPERDRFARGMFAWIGFRQTTVKFDRPPRAAGNSKYSLGKMFALALSGLVSFSDAPLRLALWCGAGVSALALLYGVVVIGQWTFADPHLERGWSSTIVVIAFLGGANMLMTGVIGLYVGRIHAEVKGRPLYIVDRAVGFEERPAEGASAAPTVARLNDRSARRR